MSKSVTETIVKITHTQKDRPVDHKYLNQLYMNAMKLDSKDFNGISQMGETVAETEESPANESEAIAADLSLPLQLILQLLGIYLLNWPLQMENGPSGRDQPEPLPFNNRWQAQTRQLTQIIDLFRVRSKSKYRIPIF
jgi:hypothetical protein